MTWIQQLKGKNRRTVTSPTHPERSYLIRRLSQTELLKAGLPVIMAAGATGTEGAALHIDDIYRTARYFLENAAVEPRIVYSDPVPENGLHVSDIEDDELWLAKEIIDFCGLGGKAKDSVETILKNEPGPGSSTSSPEPIAERLPN